MGADDMMQSYTKFYGKYAEQEWQEVEPRQCHCPACGREALEFLICEETDEVIGCTGCMTSSIPDDEVYMVPADGYWYLQCPRCGQLCDTLFASKKTTYWIDGCDECLKWIDSYEEEA